MNDTIVNYQVNDASNVQSQKAILKQVYEALLDKGYNPVAQIVGYLLSEDPAYITNCNNARSLIRKIDRDALLNEIVRNYLGVNTEEGPQ